MRLNLIVKPRNRELNQFQLNIAHNQVVDLLVRAGLPEKTYLGARKGLCLKLHVQTPKGTALELIQGDTHAIWIQHQTQENSQQFLEWVFNNGGGSVEVELVEVVRLATKGKGNVEPEQGMEDCPF